MRTICSVMWKPDWYLRFFGAVTYPLGLLLWHRIGAVFRLPRLEARAEVPLLPAWFCWSSLLGWSAPCGE